MIKELLKRAIQQKNVFMTPDMLQLQIEFFATAGKITPDDKTELEGYMVVSPLMDATKEAAITEYKESGNTMLKAELVGLLDILAK